jgi:hypothetical protein
MRQIAFAVQSRRRLAGCPEGVPSASLRCGSLRRGPATLVLFPLKRKGYRAGGLAGTAVPTFPIL